jgi:IMP dehydrogenase/GMP reductase
MHWLVQAGGMFAGHDESGGTLVEEGGQWWKDFYGMSSATAMEKHAGADSYQPFLFKVPHHA